MSEAQTLFLGLIAGVTISFGLPLGKLRAPRPGLRQFLNALAIGILVFLIWDVLVHAWEPVDGALGRLHDRTAGIGPVLGYGALFLLGISYALKHKLGERFSLIGVQTQLRKDVEILPLHRHVSTTESS